MKITASARNESRCEVANWPIARADDMHMRKPGLARWLARSLAILSLTLGIAGLVIGPLVAREWLVTHLLFSPLTTVAYALVGGLIAVRQPRNPLGWIFSAVGLFAGLISLVGDDNYLGLCLCSGAVAPCIQLVSRPGAGGLHPQRGIASPPADRANPAV